MRKPIIFNGKPIEHSPEDFAGTVFDKGAAKPVADKPAKAARKVKAQPVTPEAAPEAQPTEWLALSPGATRQGWLELARAECTRIIAEHGGDVPNAVRISFGFCSTGRKSKRIGECWAAEASTDEHREMFIVPTLTDSGVILATVLHELIHAALPPEVKHGKPFKQLATACGLTGKMTATVAGEELKAHFAEWIAANGPCPAGALRSGVRNQPKQSTRMIKAACAECGYTVRTTRKWLDVACPICPDPDCGSSGEPMECA